MRSSGVHNWAATSAVAEAPAQVDEKQWHRAIRFSLRAALLMNAVDLVLTLMLVTLGLATELNPVMAWFLELSPFAFAVAKLSLVYAGVGLLWHFRHHLIAQIGGLVIAFVYSGLMIYHLRSVDALVRHFW